MITANDIIKCLESSGQLKPDRELEETLKNYVEEKILEAAKKGQPGTIVSLDSLVNRQYPVSYIEEVILKPYSSILTIEHVKNYTYHLKWIDYYVEVMENCNYESLLDSFYIRFENYIRTLEIERSKIITDPGLIKILGPDLCKIISRRSDISKQIETILKGFSPSDWLTTKYDFKTWISDSGMVFYKVIKK